MNDQLVLPVFPLPDVILFPRTMLPLHIFEPRYQKMIRDIMEKPEDDRLIIITNLKYQGLAKGKNPFEKIGTVGKVVYIDYLDDGKSNIVIQGQFTVEINEISNTTKPYRIAEVTDIREEYWEKPLDDHQELQTKFMSTLNEYMERTNTRIKNINELRIEDLINGIARALRIDTEDKQNLLEIQILDKRLQKLEEIIDMIGYYTEYQPIQDDYTAFN